MTLCCFPFRRRQKNKKKKRKSEGGEVTDNGLNQGLTVSSTVQIENQPLNIDKEEEEPLNIDKEEGEPLNIDKEEGESLQLKSEPEKQEELVEVQLQNAPPKLDEERQARIKALQINDLKEKHLDLLRCHLDYETSNGQRCWKHVVDVLITDEKTRISIKADIEHRGQNPALDFLKKLCTLQVTIKDFKSKLENGNWKPELLDYINKEFGDNDAILLKDIDLEQKEEIARKLNSNTPGVISWKHLAGADAYKFDSTTKRNFEIPNVKDQSPTKMLFNEYPNLSLLDLKAACRREDMNVIFEEIFDDLLKDQAKKGPDEIVSNL